MKINNKVKKIKQAPLIHENHSATAKEQIKKLIRFYFIYAIKSKIFITLSLMLFVASIFLEAFTVQGNTVIQNSLCLIFPFIIEVIFISFFLSWKIFTNTNSDGTSTFIYSKSIKRNNDYIAKLILIFSMVIFIVFIQAMINLVFLIIIQTKVNYILIFSFLTFIAAVLLSFLTIGVGILISMIKIEKISLIVLSIIASISCATPFLAKIISKNENAISWNLNTNDYNYAKTYVLDGNVNPLEQKVVVYNNGTNGSSNKDSTLKNSNEYGVFFDKMILFPFSSLTEEVIKPNLSEIYASNKDFLSIYSLSESADTLATKFGANLVSYSVDDLNPVDLSYLETLSFWSKYILMLQKNNPDLTDDQKIVQFHDRLLQDKKWLSINLTSVEKNEIASLLGFNKENAVIFYLFRDWDILNTKYKNIFDGLLKNGISQSMVDLLKYLFTDNDVKDNFLNQDLIVKNSEVEALFPMSKIYDESRETTASDINDIKNLISSIDSQNVRIKLSNNNYVNLVKTNFPFVNINNRIDWNNYIDSNKELNNIRNIYKSLQTWVAASSNVLANIVFDKNSTDIYSYDKAIKINVDSSESLKAITSIVFVVLVVASFSTSFYVFKRKDFK